jgi:[ribosomal protein S5]-alanine N-acetyltransferase
MIIMNESGAFLESKRIFFSPMDEKNIDSYFNWINDRSIINYLDTGNFPKTKDQLVDYIKSVNDDPSQVMFSVFEKSSGEYIGNAKLGNIDWVNRTAKYGRMIGSKNMQGKGYGSDMALLLLYYAFNILNLNKVCAGVEEGNLSSINSNKKNGLEVEGILRQQVFSNGKYENVITMGITQSQFWKIHPHFE